MENFRPAAPLVIGVSRMKSRPGMVTIAERMKNHRRLPTMSNTAGLAAEPGPPRGSRRELVLADPVEPGLARPFVADDHAQDRAGDDDRGEHRAQDADDEDQGETLDHR